MEIKIGFLISFHVAARKELKIFLSSRLTFYLLFFYRFIALILHFSFYYFFVLPVVLHIFQMEMKKSSLKNLWQAEFLWIFVQAAFFPNLLGARKKHLILCLIPSGNIKSAFCYWLRMKEKKINKNKHNDARKNSMWWCYAVLLLNGMKIDELYTKKEFSFLLNNC